MELFKKYFKSNKTLPKLYEKCFVCKLKASHEMRILLEGEQEYEYIKIKICRGCKDEISKRYNEKAQS